MATGIGARFMQFRNMIMELAGLASDIGTATATTGAATLNAMIGQVTSEALTTGAAAEYTLTVTNDKIAAGDIVLASVDANGSAGSPNIGECTVTAGQVVITVSNTHASAAFDGAIKINFVVIKALSGITPNF